MSDFVQFRMEGTLKELKTYQNYSIFTQPEINTIISRRKSYEYKIHRTEKILIDFLHYIAYEQKLEKIIIKRTKSKRFTFVTNRILYLFTTALEKFDDDKLLIMFIAYGIKRKEYDCMRDFFEKRIMKNVKNYDLFLYAASVSIEFDDFETARMFVLKGIRFNKDQKVLYKELCRLEMRYVKKCRQINELAGIENNEGIESGSLVIAVVKEFIEKFGEDKDLLEITKEYEEIGEQVQDLIQKNK